jgi:hypothetical protein
MICLVYFDHGTSETLPVQSLPVINTFHNHRFIVNAHHFEETFGVVIVTSLHLLFRRHHASTSSIPRSPQTLIYHESIPSPQHLQTITIACSSLGDDYDGQTMQMISKRGRCYFQVRLLALSLRISSVLNFRSFLPTSKYSNPSHFPSLYIHNPSRLVINQITKIRARGPAVKTSTLYDPQFLLCNPEGYSGEVSWCEG